MLSFDYILTKEPHQICAVFVSDLHLSAHTPDLNKAFIKFINDLAVLQSLNHLFILGDFLDAWAGDDAFFNTPNHWLNPIADNLKKLKNTKTYLMHGNRDFMIGQKLCKALNATLITEPYLIDFYQKTYRLEHGDRLCTDDKNYQTYRKIIRNPLIKTTLSALPLSVRQNLAGTIKNKSSDDKQQKSSEIMNVNPQAALVALQTCDILIHGHTHRPFVHSYKKDNENNNKQRVVLGDWRIQNNKVMGEVAVLLDGGELVFCGVSD
ncbi:MAG: UDP-2,3-diacylglucosamine diphosphatase [Moraxella sp.]|nr:UDP-2,3-diacylglucosamine diphosphatase [Moraxella sp.]